MGDEGRRDKRLVAFGELEHHCHATFDARVVERERLGQTTRLMDGREGPFHESRPAVVRRRRGEEHEHRTSIAGEFARSVGTPTAPSRVWRA